MMQINKSTLYMGLSFILLRISGQKHLVLVAIPDPMTRSSPSHRGGGAWTAAALNLDVTYAESHALSSGQSKDFATLPGSLWIVNL
jgi:hypothetical protein